MSGFDKEVQKMIDTPDNSYWTQFELDLINCIRDEYPIIYSNNSGLGRYQRAGKVRSAWKQISVKFGELTSTQIRTKWKTILDNYFKVKIFSGSDAGNVEQGNKYLDGTMSFLENVDPELLMISNIKTTKDNQNYSNTGDNFEDDKKESYSLTARDLLHEEIDLDDESGMDIKEEVQEYEKEVQKWTEDELMNATRLTKEMIDELILIKTRNYYTAPSEAAKN